MFITTLVQKCAISEIITRFRTQWCLDCKFLWHLLFLRCTSIKILNRDYLKSFNFKEKLINFIFSQQSFNKSAGFSILKQKIKNKSFHTELIFKPSYSLLVRKISCGQRSLSLEWGMSDFDWSVDGTFWLI